jgi:hypothetical protein
VSGPKNWNSETSSIGHPPILTIGDYRRATVVDGVPKRGGGRKRESGESKSTGGAGSAKKNRGKERENAKLARSCNTERRFAPGRFESSPRPNVPEADKSTSRDWINAMEQADKDCEQGMKP